MSGISVSLLLPGISAASSIPAGSLQSRAGSLLSRASVYGLSFLLIDFTKGNMASALAIGKSFVLYRVSRGTVQRAVPCRTLQVERCLVIPRVVSHTFEQCLHFMPAMLKDLLLLMSIIPARVDSIILVDRTGPLSLVHVIACPTVWDPYPRSIHEYDLV